MIQWVVQDTIEGFIMWGDIEVPLAREASHSTMGIPALLRLNLWFPFSVVRTGCSVAALEDPLDTPILLR